MFNLSRQDNLNVSTSTITQEAEENLIIKLLSHGNFVEPTKQRKLACYPYANTNTKNKLICDLMKDLWPEKTADILFPVFKKFEVFLTGAGKRGHFVHQFEVYLLGLNLILTIKEKKGDINILFGEIAEELIYQTWLLTATAHDFGYPLQEAISITEHLSEQYEQLEMHDISKSYRNIQEDKNLILNEIQQLEIHEEPEIVVDVQQEIIEALKFTLNLSEERVREITEVLIGENKHGYISAIILCRTLMKKLLETTGHNIEETKKKPLYHSMLKAIGAIAVHDLPKKEENQAITKAIVENISFNRNPYAFLLFIIDNIQDWSRDLIGSDFYPLYSLEKFSAIASNIELEYVLRLSIDKWTEEKKKEIMEENQKREKLLNTAKKPDPSIGMNIILNFKNNINDSFPAIALKL